jgi:lipopolysaccharide/colanic/teichoic acid biosynthesis glycosyltransferase
MTKPLRHDRSLAVRGPSILARKRFQFLTSLVVGALVPWILRDTVLPGELLDPPVTNTLFGNLIAVAIAFWMRLSVETYPGIRRSYVILPSALTGHGIVVFWFLVLRFPYDRIGLVLGFVLHVLWLYMLYIYAERRVRRRIAVVPFGAVDRLREIDEVDWFRLSRARLHDARGCHAIVADFGADLPDEWEGFLADAALAGRMVYQVKQLWESLTGRVELEQLSENSFGSLVPARGYFHLKTIVDFFAAALLLPFALPVMAVAALAILLDDGGPVLFRQRRLGHAGRVFIAYKFRTMAMIAIEGDDDVGVRKALATDDGDPRVTRVGAVLRRYRLDELPQIFNILKGQMSWIGPRPEPEVLTHWFIAEIPFYRYRHVVKPGISGWAQVNQGYVSGLDGINRKLQYDFYYIKYFSPWLDLLILLRTVKTMLTGWGAR